MKMRKFTLESGKTAEIIVHEFSPTDSVYLKFQLHVSEESGNYCSTFSMLSQDGEIDWHCYSLLRTGSACRWDEKADILFKNGCLFLKMQNETKTTINFGINMSEVNEIPKAIY
jgi:hypothetical protein